MPTEIHSDNGTNFRGANNTLVELHRLLENKRTREAINNECSLKRIQWYFIPPRAPSFGGLWEAAVKTAKTSLVKTLGSTQLSYEDFATILTQIEANMNIGTSLQSLPEPDYTSIPSNRLQHYHELQKLVQQHWDRWRKEYLYEQNHQRKKAGSATNIQVGQIVLVQDEGKPSISWPLARIVQNHPGDDGVVRVATLRTLSGTYKRSISRIYPLPCDQQHNTDEISTPAS
ncbi:uncharacterized protein LOC134209056 [Armigeres subalbatus]|uniref:uncharacterized protein LOC134209056 n=1 Tax=Armigeres subalbatus TaxID=124917 RepID=UPI002ED079AC